MEQKLQLKSSDKRLKNMTIQHLETAAEMFVYLSLPMSNSLKLNLTFYRDLFQTKSPIQIIITLNRMLKKKPVDEDYLHIQKIFMKATTLLALKYGEIQSMMPGESGDVKNVSSAGHSIINGNSL